MRSLSVSLGLAVALAVMSMANVAGAQQIGPSFDCAKGNTPVTRIICSDPELRVTDLALVQTYYALRQAQPERQQELKEEAIKSSEQHRAVCSIPASLNALPPGQQDYNTPRARACVKTQLQNQRAIWVNKLRQTGSSGALEEVGRSAADNLALQGRLKAQGFLADNSVVDGVFGSVTRQAIMRFQSERGIAADGFISAATADKLLAGGPMATAPAVAQATPTVAPANVAVAQSQLPACQGAQTSWTHCAITITSASGRQYVGEYRAGVFTGKTSDGITYVGGIVGVQFHGQGTSTWTAGQSAGQKYVGEFRDGKRNGQGTHTWSDGRKYVGEWRDDQPNGQGTMTYADGRVESGTWSGFELQPTEQQKAQAQERQKQELQKYAARPKTVLEQVLNYTTTGKEGGDLKDMEFGYYWVSGKDGTHKCVMTSEGGLLSSFVAALHGLNFFKTVDLRQINPDGFRIKTGNRDHLSSNWSVGDENIQLPRAEGTVMERLQKAWGLALAECPPAVRKPF